MIRTHSEHKIVISHPPLRRPYSSDLGNDFLLKNTTFRASAISQDVTKCCACHEKSESKFTTYCACHENCILLFSPPLFSWHLVSTHLFSKHLFSWHLFSKHLVSKHLFSWHPFSKHLLSKHLFSQHLFSFIFKTS